MEKTMARLEGNPASPDGALPGAWLQHSRSGAWIADETGRDYLAWHVAGGVFNLGFCNPELSRQIAEIIRSHDAGLWSVPSERRDAGEKGFAQLLPEQLSRTMFLPSASEAFEVACKLAKRVTGRHELISMTRGYHGHIGFGLAMDCAEYEPELYAPLAGPVPKAVYGDIDSIAALISERTAAVCLETVQVPAGVREVPDGYLAALRKLCDAHGALLIVDEVQGGLYRTGTRWAFEKHRVFPDVVIAGKGLSGGYFPVGALICSPELREQFVRTPRLHTSSFAGNEIAASIASCIAGHYCAPGFADRVQKIGKVLEAGLAAIVGRNPAVLCGMRGRGMLFGVQVCDPRLRDRTIAACLAHGLFLRGSLDPATITVMPALISTVTEIEEGLARFESATRSVLH